MQVAIASSELERYEHARTRACIAPFIWTPCFPCLFAYVFSPSHEEAVRHRAQATKVSLEAHGLSIQTLDGTSSNCSGCWSSSFCCCRPRSHAAIVTSIVPYERIVACRIDGDGTSTRHQSHVCCCCCCCEHCHCYRDCRASPPPSICIILDGDAPPVILDGVAAPHAFVRDIFAARNGGAPTAAAQPAISEAKIEELTERYGGGVCGVKHPTALSTELV